MEQRRLAAYPFKSLSWSFDPRIGLPARMCVALVSLIETLRAWAIQDIATLHTYPPAASGSEIQRLPGSRAASGDIVDVSRLEPIDCIRGVRSETESWVLHPILADDLEHGELLDIVLRHLTCEVRQQSWP